MNLSELEKFLDNLDNGPEAKALPTAKTKHEAVTRLTGAMSPEKRAGVYDLLTGALQGTKKDPPLSEVE